MIEKLKELIDKVSVPTSTFIIKYTNKLSVRQRKIFSIAIIALWVIALLPANLLNNLPLIGDFIVVFWILMGVFVVNASYDVWQTTKQLDDNKK